MRWACMLAVLLMAIVTVRLSALEMLHRRVVQVIDGDTLVIENHGALATIRLLWIDTPETDANRQRMRDMRAGFQGSSPVRFEGANAAGWLWTLVKSSGMMVDVYVFDDRMFDAYRRYLGVVYPAEAEPAGSFHFRRLAMRASFQERIIQAGHSVYWKRYGTAEPYAEALHHRLLMAESLASQMRRGLWSTHPEWMLFKSSELRKLSHSRATRRHVAWHDLDPSTLLTDDDLPP